SGKLNKLYARDIMTPTVKSVPQSWTMQQFSAFLSDNNISGSPVANQEGQLIGIATLKDIADFHLNSVDSSYEEQLSEEEKLEARRLRMMIFEGMAKLPVEVGDIMTPIIFSVDEETAIVDVAKLMMEEHLHRVFVKKGEDLSGIITTYDLLKVIVDEAAS
ncbi:HPP family protein, partial [Oleiphilus sp. HI0043]|uniref:CBS domain-containing protein n=1 Tax=Oleiphilus sp. HI0043 TaxID=1822233 RepID=UPI000A491141